MQCSNNLAQIGIAFHSFELTYGTLPSGVTNSTGPIRYEPTGDHTSWTVRLMPYLEQAALYEKLDLEKGIYDPANRSVRQFRLPTYLCPSSPLPQLSSFDEKPIASTSYAGSHHSVEAPIDVNNDGVLFLNSRLPFNEITDGLSNTLIVGEKLSIDDKLGWMSGTRDTLRNTSSINATRKLLTSASKSGVAATQDTETVSLGGLGVGGFDSYHTGGMNGVRCDGSVTFFSSGIDKDVLRTLGSRGDGETLQDNYSW